MRTVVWFDAVTAGERSCLGGKCSGIAGMISAGLPVPPGFAVTTHAFRLARDRSGVVPAITGRLDGLDPGDPRDVASRAAAVRELGRPGLAGAVE